MWRTILRCSYSFCTNINNTSNAPHIAYSFALSFFLPHTRRQKERKDTFLRIAPNILLDLKLFGLLDQLMGLLIHCWSFLAVEEAAIQFFCLHCQDHSLRPVRWIMICGQWHHCCIPGIKRMIECWARAKHMNE